MENNLLNDLVKFLKTSDEKEAGLIYYAKCQKRAKGVPRGALFMYKCHILKQVGGFCESKSICPYQELNTRLKNAGYRVIKFRDAHHDPHETGSLHPCGVMDPDWQRSFRIVFIPHSGYHVWTMGLIMRRLKDKGISSLMIDTSLQRRTNENRAKIEQMNLPRVSFNRYMLGQFHPDIVVCMNDTEPIARTIVEDANKKGIKTIGIVEGVHDFAGIDADPRRWTYKRVQYVFLSGKDDERFFQDRLEKTRVIGIPRLDVLMKDQPKFPTQPLIIINLNFTYGVLEAFREKWLGTILKVCHTLRLDYTISQHPADHGDVDKKHLWKGSMYDAIRAGSLFVSRFGTGIIEALAMGKPVVYFNPGFEKIDKFCNPLGAYQCAKNEKELIQAIEEGLQDQENIKERAKYFLRRHAHIVKGTMSATESAASGIIQHLKGR